MLDQSPSQAEEPVRLSRVQRTKFDRWLFDHDVDNVSAARMLAVHALSIGRWRKRYDDPGRVIPPTKIIRAVETLTQGEVRFEDWDRPCDVAYVVTALEVEAVQ